jgi:hypothetical protein
VGRQAELGETRKDLCCCEDVPGEEMGSDAVRCWGDLDRDAGKCKQLDRQCLVRDDPLMETGVETEVLVRTLVEGRLKVLE